jgi:hypothetical protein
VTADIAAALSGVSLVALFAAVLAMPAAGDGEPGGWLVVAAGLLGVGAGAGISRLAVAVATGRGRADVLVLGVGVGVGVTAGVVAGAVLGVVADISVSESIMIAGAAAVSALIVDLGLARDSAAGGGKGQVVVGPASRIAAAILPFAVAAPVVYLLGRFVSS